MKVFSYIFFGSVLAFSLYSCEMESQNPYVRKIDRERFTRDSFYKSSPESPFSPKAQRELISLDYYKPDPKYDLKAKLELFDVPKSIMMQRTNTAAEEFYIMGNVVFTLDGKQYRLPVYKSAKFVKDPSQANDLFCPFTDLTTGHETYKSGRFLDLHQTVGSNEIELDFNEAYNPYCAYNHDYSCPVPPPESHLDVKIEAGEKAFKKGRISFFK